MILASVIAGLVLLPFSIFFAVKWGRFGFLLGTQHFLRWKREHQQRNLDLRTHSSHE